MRKHIKRVSSDSGAQPAQPQATSGAASALMNYFGGKKLSDITKLYNNNQKYLQNMPTALNASLYNPTYGNQLKKFAYYFQNQQYPKQQNPAAANQYAPEIHLINFPGFAQPQVPLNGQPAQHASPNVMNQATNAYPTFSQPAASQPPQVQLSNKPAVASHSAPQPAQPVQQFQPIKVNQPVQPAATSSAVSQKQQQQQQQALIQQAIQNPHAFISQYITQHYPQQQQQQQQQAANANSNNSPNNSNKLAGDASAEANSDLADEYSGSSYYYGQPQVSVSSSTSTKVSGHKPTASNPQSSPSSNQSSSSSSSAASNQPQSNSNASA